MNGLSNSTLTSANADISRSKFDVDAYADAYEVYADLLVHHGYLDEGDLLDDPAGVSQVIEDLTAGELAEVEVARGILAASIDVYWRNFNALAPDQQSAIRDYAYRALAEIGEDLCMAIPSIPETWDPA